MPRTFNITKTVKATFETWTALTPSNTLVLNAHGMQDKGKIEVGTSDKPLLAKRNYAFTVPWDRALFNPFFKNNEKNITGPFLGI